MPTITTPRPPLNIFDAARAEATSDTWVTLYETPDYKIPASGPNPERTVKAVALLTSLIVANNTNDTIQFSMRIFDELNDIWQLLNELSIPANDFALIELGKQNLPSGERLQIKVNSGQAAVASLSYVLNQREEYEEIT